MNEFQIYLIYLLIINIFTFLVFGIDKLKAIKDSFRISEKTLLTFCLVGGALGGLLGMLLFHHKTKKPKFFICIPLLVVIYIILTLFLIFYLI